MTLLKYFLIFVLIFISNLSFAGSIGKIYDQPVCGVINKPTIYISSEYEYGVIRNNEKHYAIILKLMVSGGDMSCKDDNGKSYQQTLNSKWESSDGKFEILPNQEFSYQKLRLVLKENINQARVNVQLQDGLGKHVINHLLISPRSLPVPSVSIKAQSSYPLNQYSYFNAHTSDSRNYKFDWDMGDGGSSNGQDVKYKYTDEGQYKINLTAINEYGDKYTDSKIIVISNEVDPTSTKSDIDIKEFDSKLTEGSSINLSFGFKNISSENRTISLTTSNGLSISPKTVTIPANSSSQVNVTVTAIDDNIVNGNRTATITATSSHANTPETISISIKDNDKDNENTDALTPKLGINLLNNQIIEGTTSTDIIVYLDKPASSSIDININSSDPNLYYNHSLKFPFHVNIPQGKTESSPYLIRMDGNKYLDDNVRKITLTASTTYIDTPSVTTELYVYENSDTNEKSNGIAILSGVDLGEVTINNDSTTSKDISLYVKNNTNQYKYVTVKVLRQEGQKNLLFDKERSCQVAIEAGKTESCIIKLRFDEDASTGEHSLKIVGSASGDSYFTAYKVISVVNNLKQSNYGIIHQVNSSIKQKLGEILDYGNSVVIQAHGDGDCIRRIPYKFFLKHLATNQIITVSQGYVDACDAEVILDKQSSVKLNKVGVYKFWTQIYPPMGSDSNTDDNKTSEMTITVEGNEASPENDKASQYIDKCISTLSKYCGSKVGEKYSCKENSLCQKTTGTSLTNVTNIAIDKNITGNEFYYYWDIYGGWSKNGLSLSYCGITTKADNSVKKAD